MSPIALAARLLLVAALVLAAPGRALTPAAPELTEVVSTGEMQLTGVTLSREGRLFVNFPRWSDAHYYSVVEVLPGGRLRAYPDRRWNTWSPSLSPAERFVCVQSVWVDDENRLWVLDPASPKMQGVVEGGAKLVGIDLATDEVEQVIRFGPDVAPADSYLNDVRVDTVNDVAYLTDSGTGALVVVNLADGSARRVLAEHPSTTAEDIVPVIGGRALRNQQGEVPRIHADGIALSHDGEWLYYHALTGYRLYRLPTSVLRSGASDQEIADAVQDLGPTVVSDGMLIDGEGNVYHTALEHDAIVRRTPDGRMETVVRHPRIQWPDSLAWGPDGDLYFTISQIHLTPRFNNGVDGTLQSFKVFKVDMPDDPAPRRP